MNEIEKMLFGKNELSHIVAVEVQDRLAEVFTEVNGKVDSIILPNKYWILSNRAVDSTGWVRLKGNLHYKFGKQYEDRDTFARERSMFARYNDIFSIWNPTEALMVKDGIRMFQGMKHTEVSVLSFDIESSGLVQDGTSMVYIISNTFRRNGEIIRKMFCYDDYEYQNEMLEAWCEWVREMDPSVICGHNIFGYDLPYLQHVADLSGAELKLGRDESPIVFDNYDSKFRKDQSQDLTYKRSHIWGRQIVDTMFLAIRYDVAEKKYESYGLKSIIATEGLEIKDRQFYDASQIRFKYNDPEEWKKIKTYALHDADDALALFDLMCPAQFYLTRSVPKTFEMVCCSATGSQINSMMCASYLQDAHSLPKASEVVEFSGAISRGSPGIHSNVLSFDVASLYPSVMLEYQIYSKDKDPSAHLLKILQELTVERFKNKKIGKETNDPYYKALEQSQKVLINSMYGFMGTRGLLFNYPEGAAKVTEMGRETLKSGIKFLSGLDFETWEKEKHFVEDAEEVVESV